MEPKHNISPNAVFSALDRQREDGTLSVAIANGKPKYQASQSEPGMLEMVLPDGSAQVGKFFNGAFVKSES